MCRLIHLYLLRYWCSCVVSHVRCARLCVCVCTIGMIPLILMPSIIHHFYWRDMFYRVRGGTNWWLKIEDEIDVPMSGDRAHLSTNSLWSNQNCKNGEHGFRMLASHNEYYSFLFALPSETHHKFDDEKMTFHRISFRSDRQILRPNRLSLNHIDLDN